jgi:hypothetical protein
MTTAGSTHRLPDGSRRRFWPRTRVGTWAIGLAIASVVLGGPLSRLGLLGGITGLAVGAAGGLVALIAILRRRERAISVFLAVVPLAFVVLFVVLELTGHA